ncbi:glycosyl hydrolase [Gracilibacillus phocaeensis]|uniref:glycosyl hydrolase n=1 Tax=Gracilibacillus phocaeensis TaxID=2042304 RepID=UPI0010327226|nr:glycosyl hydrolase [Gracilibacillus phocaeensis]
MEKTMEKTIHSLFLKPTNAYRGKPFWSWNGKLEKKELLRQIGVLKEMGFGGFFMHSRTGLVTEYLSEEWFDLINTCAEEAEKLGMEAWLYDEDRWPSGTAGGLVTQNPAYRLKFIRLEIISSDQFNWGETSIAAFSCKLEELSVFDVKQLMPDQSYNLTSDQIILHFTIEEMEKESFYNGYTYLDTLNKQATEQFLAQTHEKYKKYAGKHLGKAIKGIFTDEPHRGSLMDGFAIQNQDKAWLTPWTYRLFDEFKKKYGYDLVAKLPELFLHVDGQKISQVKLHYTELLQEMFIENFAKPMQDWCSKNNLILTGHVLHEDSLTAQTAVSGSVMRYYEHMDYPGVDVLTEKNQNYWIVKQLSSVARQVGKKWLLSELYGCTGWQMSFENHKSVGDWQALFGINLRCHHLSWYTMEGEAKRDYPASISDQSAWWCDYDYVETYFSRLGVVMTHGKPECAVLVINPIESVWCQVYPGWSENLTAKSPEVQNLEAMQQDLFHWLSGAQIDFDYGDEEMMARLFTIDEEENEPILHVGDAAYKVVIVSGMTTIRATTVNILEKFIEVGGKVIFAGDPPEYIEAVKNNCTQSMTENAIQIPFQKDALIKTCYQSIHPYIQVLDAKTNKPIEKVYSQIRVNGEEKFILLINMDRENNFDDVRIIVNDENKFIEEWDAVTGEKYSSPYEVTNAGLEIATNFVSSGEHLYVITPEKNEQLSTLEKKTEEIIGDIEGDFSYVLNEENVCVLDSASYQIEESNWQDEQEILKIDREIREKLGMRMRSGDMIQPWYINKFHHSTTAKKHPLKLKFPFYIQDIPQEPVQLVMERPDLFKIMINGKKVEISDNLTPWIDHSFKRVPFPLRYLTEGDNFVELETEFHEAINLEAIYLIGEFGVSILNQKNMLTKLPGKIKIGDLTKQGFPFYSGSVTYKLDYRQIEKPLKPYHDLDYHNILLSFSEFEAACIKIHSEDKKTDMIAWQPYNANITDEVRDRDNIDIEVILTRRNTFGPLHLNPVHSIAYGPEHFITEGEAFSDDYMLIPSGLLAKPQLKKQ